MKFPPNTAENSSPSSEEIIKALELQIHNQQAEIAEKEKQTTRYLEMIKTKGH